MINMKTEATKDKQPQNAPTEKKTTSQLKAKSQERLIDKHFLFRMDGVTDGYVLGYN